MTEQQSFLIAVLLKPFAALLLFAALAAIRILLVKKMPDSILKRILLLRLGKRRSASA